MSIKSFKAFVAEADYAKGIKHTGPTSKEAGGEQSVVMQGSSCKQDKTKQAASSDGITQGKAGEKQAVKQGSSKMNENVAADFKAPADSDEEATSYKPRAKGEEKFKDMHTMKHTKHPVAGDHQFDGSRGEVRK